MHLEPSGQVLAKEGLVVDALERIGRIPPGSFKLLPTVGTGTDTGTRRRAVLHWAAKRLGFFGRRTHQAVAVDVCPALVATLAPLPGKLSAPLAPVGPALKAVHLLAEEGAVSLALELRGRIGPKSRQVAESLIRSGVVRGVVLVEPEGRTEEVGRPVLEAPAPQAPGVRLKLRADAFAQAHGQGAATLVERALGMLAPRPEDRALELYAGNGAFTFALASRLASVVAVESSPLSSALASSAARQSNVTNVRWVQGDASRVAEGLVKEGARFELLLADPPRTGAPALSRTARALGVRTVVYVGCDAGTLSRDAGRLVEAGFRLREVQLVDLFPNTHHVEVLLAFAA